MADAAPSADSDERAARLRRVLESCRFGADADLLSTVSGVLTNHSDLLPELEAELRAELEKRGLRTDAIAAWASRPAVPERIGAVRMLRLIGRGGMGVVYLGHDELLDRRVAVKLLLDAVSGPNDPDFRVFLEGARSAVAVIHPNLTTVFHADVHDGVPVLVMDYVDGASLGALLRVTGPLSPSEVCLVLGAVCEALATLHDHGIVHRDVKLDNVLVDVAGAVYLTDFGLAVRRRETDSGRATHIAGTRPYMAPEALAGAVGIRTDIYALGIMTHELLTGVRRNRPGAPLEDGEVRPEYAEPLLRATHVQPSFRFKSARHFLSAFWASTGVGAASAATRTALAARVASVQTADRSGAAAGTEPAAGGIESVGTQQSATGPERGPEYYAALAGAAAARKADRPALPPAEPAPERHRFGTAVAERCGATMLPVLRQDLPCIKCHYNLRGVETEARCPECGAAVADSTRPELLRFADPNWLRGMSRGLVLVLVGYAIGAMVLANLAPVVRVAFSAPRSESRLGAGSGFSTLAEPARRLTGTPAVSWTVPVTAAGLAVNVSACLVLLIGGWLVTRPDPNSPGGAPLRGSQGRLRVVGISMVGLDLLELGVIYWSDGHVVQRGSVTPFEWPPLWCALLRPLLLVAAVLATRDYVRAISRLLHDPMPPRRMLFGVWLIAAGVLLVLVVVLATRVVSGEWDALPLVATIQSLPAYALLVPPGIVVDVGLLAVAMALIGVRRGIRRELGAAECVALDRARASQRGHATP